MKPFRFPLETVLETRRAQEEEARRQLAAALDRQRQAMARSADALRALNVLFESIASQSTGRFTVADRERSWTLRRAQEQICEQLRAAAQECGRQSEEKRGILVQMRRNRELIERLKETRFEAWRKEAERLEQLQFDEFAMTRRHQASQQDKVLC